MIKHELGEIGKIHIVSCPRRQETVKFPVYV